MNNRPVLGSSRFEEQIGLLHNDVNPRLVVFHQYEPHLAVADERDGVRYVNLLGIL